MRRVPALAVLFALVLAAPAAAAPAVVRVVQPSQQRLADADAGRTAFLVDPDAVPSWRHPEIAVTYSVGVQGDVDTGLEAFRRVAADALTDERGWSMGGRIAFVRDHRKPDLRLWLAAPESVAAAAAACDADYSCRVGDDVYINARRWREGTETYRHRDRAEYRRYVINHEVGHWLGLDHRGCRGVGEQAPVMLQQSKWLDGCDARAWPLPHEQREALGNLRG